MPVSERCPEDVRKTSERRCARRQRPEMTLPRAVLVDFARWFGAKRTGKARGGRGRREADGGGARRRLARPVGNRAAAPRNDIAPGRFRRFRASTRCQGKDGDVMRSAPSNQPCCLPMSDAKVLLVSSGTARRRPEMTLPRAVCGRAGVSPPAGRPPRAEGFPSTPVGGAPTGHRAKTATHSVWERSSR
jgi:hypothetical protein